MSENQDNTPNIEEVIDLYQKAIAQGDAEAMNSMAYMHQQGDGVAQDYAKAIELYDQAIELGHPTAMTNRAFMHQNAQGGEKDYTKAIALYEKAMALGHPVATSNRAFMLQHGQGTGTDGGDGKPNLKAALEYYTIWQQIWAIRQL